MKKGQKIQVFNISQYFPYFSPLDNASQTGKSGKYQGGISCTGISWPILAACFENVFVIVTYTPSCKLDLISVVVIV